MVCLITVAGCRPQQQSVAQPDARKGPAPADERRLLYAQIVEDATPNVFAESAILEGNAYRHFLRAAAATTHDKLRKQTNDKITFDDLMAQPGRYRGNVVTLQRGVVIEVTKVKLPADAGLPEGYTTFFAVFVDSARDVYGLRTVCPPGSTLFEKLEQAIAADALPVMRVSGYFMKLYARRTADPREPPWRRPLLICPEPEFSQAVEPRAVADEMATTGTDKLLPSERIDAPGADERMIVEVFAPMAGSNEPIVRVAGKLAGAELTAFFAAALNDFRPRLPAAQQAYPSAVVLLAPKASRVGIDKIVAALKAAGINRLAVKREE